MTDEYVDDRHPVSVTVNGTPHRLTVESRRTLADMLRHDLGYTGTHLGCEHGICGACTVLVDDVPARACLMFGVQVDGREVRTVEGLATGDELSDLQQAFSDHHGLQCGFCTPGFLMLAEAFLAENPSPTEDEIRDVVSANLCRCTGYQGIVEAIAATAVSRAGTAAAGDARSAAGTKPRSPAASATSASTSVQPASAQPAPAQRRGNGPPSSALNPGSATADSRRGNGRTEREP